MGFRRNLLRAVFSNVHIASINSVVLPDSCDIRRDAVRPVEQQEDSYLEHYDAKTLLFDIVDTGEEYLIAVAPPLLNLADEVYLWGVPLSGYFGGLIKTSCAELSEFMYINRSLLKNGQLVFTDSEGFAVGAVKPSRATDGDSAWSFEGLNVVHTLQKDEPIEWITDWALYHHRIHGANALSIYDNGSTAYTLEQLAEALNGVEGYERIVITSWPFPYGPQGGMWFGVNTPWDSCFTQLGAIEHARIARFSHARGVLNLDIDEYLAPLTSEKAFEALESSEKGALSFNGIWIQNTERFRNPQELPRAFEYLYCNPYGYCNKKWGIVPDRVPFEDVRARTHWLVEEKPVRHALLPDADPRFIFGHYRGLTRGWKDKTRMDVLDSGGYEICMPMLVSMNRAFGDDRALGERFDAMFLEINRRFSEAQEQLQAQKVTRIVSAIEMLFGSHVSDHHWSKHFRWEKTMLAWETKDVLSGTLVFSFVVEPEPLSLSLRVFVRQPEAFDQLSALMEKKGVDRGEPLNDKDGYLVVDKASIDDITALEDACQPCFDIVNALISAM